MKSDNVNVHRAAAKISQAGKAARPAAPVQRIVTRPILTGASRTKRCLFITAQFLRIYRGLDVVSVSFATDFSATQLEPQVWTQPFSLARAIYRSNQRLKRSIRGVPP